MTGGYRSKHFRYDCAAKGCFQQAGESWDDIIEAFPRGIRPTDIDGMVEINGNLLFIEEKSTPGATLTNGQRYSFRALAEHDGITVVVFRPSGEPGGVEVMVFNGMPGTPRWERMTRAALVERIRQWASRVDKRGGDKKLSPAGPGGAQLPDEEVAGPVEQPPYAPDPAAA